MVNDLLSYSFFFVAISESLSYHRPDKGSYLDAGSTTCKQVEVSGLSPFTLDKSSRKSYDE